MIDRSQILHHSLVDQPKWRLSCQYIIRILILTLPSPILYCSLCHYVIMSFCHSVILSYCSCCSSLGSHIGVQSAFSPMSSGQVDSTAARYLAYDLYISTQTKTNYSTQSIQSFEPMSSTRWLKVYDT